MGKRILSIAAQNEHCVAPWMGKQEQLIVKDQGIQQDLKEIGQCLPCTEKCDEHVRFSKRLIVEEVVWGEVVVFLGMTVLYFHLLISTMKITEKTNYQKRSRRTSDFS